MQTLKILCNNVYKKKIVMYKYMKCIYVAVSKLYQLFSNYDFD